MSQLFAAVTAWFTGPGWRVHMANEISREDFAGLYSRCHLDLLRYVLTLLPDRATAEDVVQETARLLWQKFDEYDPARPFGPWARRFAYFEVLKARKRATLHGKYFSADLVELLAEERVAEEETLAAQREALVDCLGQLDGASRELVLERYGTDRAVQDLALAVGKSPNAVSLGLRRIRQKLVECVNRKLRVEGWS